MPASVPCHPLVRVSDHFFHENTGSLSAQELGPETGSETAGLLHERHALFHILAHRDLCMGCEYFNRLHSQDLCLPRSPSLQNGGGLMLERPKEDLNEHRHAFIFKFPINLRHDGHPPFSCFHIRSANV
jgi:hypothetical protein